MQDLIYENQGEKDTYHAFGLPGWLSGKELACQCRRHGFDPWVRKIPWRIKWQPTPVFLPGESYGRRSLVGYSPQGHKESDTTEWLHLHSATKEKEQLIQTKTWTNFKITMLSNRSWRTNRTYCMISSTEVSRKCKLIINRKQTSSSLAMDGDDWRREENEKL